MVMKRLRAREDPASAKVASPCLGEGGPGVGQTPRPQTTRASRPTIVRLAAERTQPRSASTSTLKLYFNLKLNFNIEVELQLEVLPFPVHSLCDRILLSQGCVAGGNPERSSITCEYVLR